MEKTIERQTKEKELIADIESTLPEFVKACNSDQTNAVILHQDAFAEDLQEHEFLLLGKAIKYAGLAKKDITIISNK